MARLINKDNKLPPIIVPNDYVGEHSYKEILEAQTYGESIKESKFPPKNRDWITFIDIDHNRDGVKATKKAYDYITLPTIPLEVNYEVESEVSAIASFGRNNPFYMFTGSEDSLSFQIDFYSKIASKQDVIYWCRWLESMTKVDGYVGGLHRILVIWGKDDKLFGGETWFITKASYKLSQFQGHKSLLPAQAYSDIVLKRVVDHNRTTQEIFGRFFQPALPSDGWSGPPNNTNAIPLY